MFKSTFNFCLTALNVGLTIYTGDEFFMFLAFFTFASGILCYKIEQSLEGKNDRD